jgi:hypothetical protein
MECLALLTLRCADAAGLALRPGFFRILWVIPFSSTTPKSDLVSKCWKFQLLILENITKVWGVSFEAKGFSRSRKKLNAFPSRATGNGKCVSYFPAKISVFLNIDCVTFLVYLRSFALYFARLTSVFIVDVPKRRSNVFSEN